MKYKNVIIALLLTSLNIFPGGVFAQDITAISDSLFQTNEQITISGQNLLQISDSSYVCFNSDSACYTSTSDGMVNWLDRSISFLIPTGIDFKGSIYVTDEKLGNLGAFDYTVQPTIFQKYYGNTPATQGLPGAQLSLYGDAFGNNKGSVKFGSIAAVIQSWANDRIDLIVPAPNTADTQNMKICRTDDVCTDLPFFTPKQIFNDPLAGQQNYLHTIKYDLVYNLLQPQEEIVVAVVDNGVYAAHPDLQGRLWANTDEQPGDARDNDGNGYIDDHFGYNFMDDSNDMTPKGDHGTAMSGVIAANRNNKIGIAGLATIVKIMPVIACGETDCSSLDVEKAVRYAVDNGAKIVNLSLSAIQLQAYLPSYDVVFKYAYEHGVLIIVAAGNGDPETDIGRDLDKSKESPVCNDAGVNAVLGVGATTNEGIRTGWSNYGKCVDVYAPGEDIMSTDYAGTKLYGVQSGTSMSVPIISGLAAQVWSAYPEMEVSTLRDYMIAAGSTMIDAQKLFTDVQNGYKSYFSDVGVRYKNALAITYLKEQGIIQGYTDGTFRPEQGVTRAELLKILIKGGLGIEPGEQFQQNCFKDVKASDWYSQYLCYAKDQGWADGYADGNFRPNQNINKVEAIKLLVEINDLKQSNLAFVPYADVPEGAWYERYLKTAFEMGLLEEKSNMYNPGDLMTRGSIAESIYRLLLSK